MTIDQSAAGETIELTAGESLTVRLQENPTTGYQWSVESATGLELTGSTVVVSGIPGGSGIHEFTFGTHAPGRYNLHLKKWRSWEGDSSATERFTVIVIVA